MSGEMREKGGWGKGGKRYLRKVYPVRGHRTEKEREKKKIAYLPANLRIPTRRFCHEV